MLVKIDDLSNMKIKKNYFSCISEFPLEQVYLKVSFTLIFIILILPPLLPSPNFFAVHIFMDALICGTNYQIIVLWEVESFRSCISASFIGIISFR